MVPRGWLSRVVLGVALLLVLGSAAQVAYRLTLPTDGWLWIEGDIGSADQNSFTYTVNQFGRPSPIRPGDYLLTVDGLDARTTVTDRGWAGQGRPPAGWRVGGTATYEVRRDGYPVTLLVPLYGWTAADVLRIALASWLVAAVFVAIGLFVFLKRPDSWAARALLMFSAAVGALIVSGSISGPSPGLPELFSPVGPVALFLTNWLWAFGMIPSFLLLSLVFPVPKRWVSSRPRLVVAGASSWTPLWVLVSRGQASVGWATVAVFGMLSLVAIGHSVLTVREPVARAQARWVLAGFGLAGLNIVLVSSAGFGVLPAWLPPLPTAQPIGVIAVPVTFAIAILRYRLFDIDVILNRALVWGAMTIFVIGAYVGIVAYLGAIFRSRGSLLWALVATGVVAVAFQPMREVLQRGVDRILYGQRAEPYVVVTGLGARLEAAFEPASILPVIVSTVAESLRLPYVAIEVAAEEGPEVVASWGTAPERPESFSLTHQGRRLGSLLAGPRRGEDALSRGDHRLLTQLARQAGAAVHGVRLMDDLQRSRERLVLAREEERRRIRRDLHDDLAPTLAGLALTSATVSQLVHDDPSRAAELADRLQGELAAVVAGVRRLVDDLRPAALDELGLVGALREHAGHFAGAGRLQVDVEAPDNLPALPAAVEVAAYRVAQEALMNVARHAGAGNCRIRLVVGETVRLEIADDGSGMGEDRRPGVGLASMRERAAELGGTFEISSSPAGTLVAVSLPLPA